MKCHKPNTDQAAEFRICVNGIPCDEYILPTIDSTDDSNILSCFIPVTEGDQLTISGSFTRSVLHASFDVLADGSFLADKRIEGPKNGEPKFYKKRKLAIKSVFDSPIEEGRMSIYAPDKIVEGNLHVKALRDGYEGSPLDVDARKHGVGSLVAVCSMNQRTNDNYENPYKSSTCGDWSSRSQDGVTDGGITPTHELEVKVMDADVSKTKQQKHKRHLIQTGFGLKPWARFIFDYRSQNAIEEAGCERRGAEAQALEPGDAETFIKGTTEPVKKAAGGKKGKKTEVTEDDEITVASSVGRTNSIFTTPPPSSEMATSSVERFRPTATPTPAPETPAPEELKRPLPSIERETPSEKGSELLATPPPMKKRKFFGQTLTSPSSAAISPLAERSRTVDTRDVSPASEELAGVVPFSDFNEALKILPGAASAQQQQEDVEKERLPIMNEQELNGAIVSAEAFLSGIAPSQPTAPAAQMISPEVVAAAGGASGNATNSVNAGPTEQTQERPTHVQVKEEEPASPSLPLHDNPTKVDTASPSLPPTLLPKNTGEVPLNPTESSTHPASRIERYMATPEPSHMLDQLDGSMTSPPTPAHDKPSQHSASQPSEDLRTCTLTVDQIKPHIPPEGIKINDLRDCFDEDLCPSNRKSKQIFWMLVREIAVNVHDLYFLKEEHGGQPIAQLGKVASMQQTLKLKASQGNQPSQSQAKLSQSQPSRVKSPQPEESQAQNLLEQFGGQDAEAAAAEQEVDNAKRIKTETTEDTQHQIEGRQELQSAIAPKTDSTSQETPGRANPAETAAKSETSPAIKDTKAPAPALTQQHLPTSPCDLTKKRPASVMATSRESTPSKKPRFDALSAKKAALLKQLEEKKARKLTAKKAPEEQQKVREEEERLREEAEMQEIEMLEKMAADEDEEYDALTQTHADEGNEIEEARKAREKAEGAIREASEEL